MKKMVLVVMSLVLLVGVALAGEYQRESAAYEKAFQKADYAGAAALATTGVGKGNALNAQGLGELKAGNLAKAEELFRAAITADAEQYWAYKNLGAALVMQGKSLDEACSMFQKSVEVNGKATDSKAEERIEAAKACLAEIGCAPAESGPTSVGK